MNFIQLIPIRLDLYTRPLHYLLSAPDTLDRLGNANIVCLELVETNSDNKCCKVQQPHQTLSYSRHTVVWNVINDNGPVKYELISKRTRF